MCKCSESNVFPACKCVVCLCPSDKMLLPLCECIDGPCHWKYFWKYQLGTRLLRILLKWVRSLARSHTFVKYVGNVLNAIHASKSYQWCEWYRKHTIVRRWICVYFVKCGVKYLQLGIIFRQMHIQKCVRISFTSGTQWTLNKNSIDIASAHPMSWDHSYISIYTYNCVASISFPHD